MQMIVFVIFLGVVQGLTEFLPVSSSGHLAFLENLSLFVNYNQALQKEIPLLSFNVILHAGTLLAVVFYYRQKLWQLWLGIIEGIKNKQYNGDIHYVWLLFWATLPVLSVPLYKSYVEQATHRLLVLGILFIVNAGIILLGQFLFRRWQKKQLSQPVGNFKYYQALWIGLWQLLAVFPGISRSGATISAAVSQNMKGEDAVEFSFLMSLPVLLAALILEGREISTELSSLAFIWLVVGFLASLISGWLSLKLLTWLGKKMLFTPFALYTFILGVWILFALT